MKMQNSYTKIGTSFFYPVKAAYFPNSKLLLINTKLMSELSLNFEDLTDNEWANVFSGQRLIDGSAPVALAYSGFQFGHPSPLLGDGRAMLLGELNGFDIQLKGSGQTPFSRRGDGRSALGPVLREYIISEFMYRMKIPTTRALAAVETGENVLRQYGDEPGGILTRVAQSHLRVGSFQYYLFKKDIDGMRSLLNYSVERHYSHLEYLSMPEKALEFLAEFSQRQGHLIAQWSGLGFVHGVMNTDNCSIPGLTIDFGPCAFLEEFRFHKVFSSIDSHGRYSFYNQVPIIQWNILRLADCLLPIIDEDEKKAIRMVEERIHPILSTFENLRNREFARKLGLTDYMDGDDHMIVQFLTYLEEHQLDFTLAFRNIKKLLLGDSSFYPASDKLVEVITYLKARKLDVESLDSINPIYIPRNHLIEDVIRNAYNGNMESCQKLIEVLSDPFTENEKYIEYSIPAEIEKRVEKTFCGT